MTIEEGNITLVWGKKHFMFFKEMIYKLKHKELMAIEREKWLVVKSTEIQLKVS